MHAHHTCPATHAHTVEEGAKAATKKEGAEVEERSGQEKQEGFSPA